MLLCRRAIEPRHGLWTLPAGFMENGETLAAGAVRETIEEARARREGRELDELDLQRTAADLGASPDFDELTG